MRESAKLEKTKLPVDVYEGWLKVQARQPEKSKRVVVNATETYEAWLDKRVEKRVQETSVKRSHAPS